jgi:hypothetical protein
MNVKSIPNDFLGQRQLERQKRMEESSAKRAGAAPETQSKNTTTAKPDYQVSLGTAPSKPPVAKAPSYEANSPNAAKLAALREKSNAIISEKNPTVTQDQSPPKVDITG